MKIKVGVIFGGKSVEHEISIISALQAIQSLNPEKYDVIPIYVTKNNEFYTGYAVGDIAYYRGDIKELLKISQRVLLVSDENRVKLIAYPIKRFSKGYVDYIDVAFPGAAVDDEAYTRRMPALAHWAHTVMNVSMLSLRICSVSVLNTEVWAARWNTPSTFSLLTRNLPMSDASSPFFLSMPITSWPPATRKATRAFPMKPSLPVTIYFAMVRKSS